ncbi:hypothetical protein [Sorangium cellulosum]|uniref:DUF2325 domain-containing protein n=1 Tax=Sorangium cellulosum So0157-2 TaxID=1254432 RepID=S4XNK3_SORCE|nr:hypothetical protein [Sorangium cellulosum]AGP34757.1 hypothetical protein SCE1572_09675 [Sorangium cellulosum So0157-2]
MLVWLAENAPTAEVRHPADFLPAEIAERAQEALARSPEPPPAQEPVERRCADCMKLPAKPGIRAVEIGTDAVCDMCGSSANKRAALAMIEAFRTRGLRRLLVVGGGPGTAEDLRRLLAGEVDIRIVDGEGHRNAAKADADLRWADVVAVWSSTILSHKVSKLYTDRRDAFGGKLVTVPRRGVAALCMAVIEKVGLTTW